MAAEERGGSSLLQQAQLRLARAAGLQGRPGIVVLDSDISALDELTGSRVRSHSLIKGLERDGRMRHVRRGAYALVDSTGSIRVGVLDLVAALTPSPYLVTGGRALQFHELTGQHFRRLHVLATGPLRPWSWRGDEVLYVRTDGRRLRGATRTRKTRARIATPARGIADSLGHPRWGVTLGQVVEALATMLERDRDFADALAVEVSKNGNHALARRLGFLVSQLTGAQASRPFLTMRGASKASTPLQAGGRREGSIDATWQVRVNVELGRLLQRREVR
jgi:predicted transcriptional regulator of viral defense system